MNRRSYLKTDTIEELPILFGVSWALVGQFCFLGKRERPNAALRECSPRSLDASVVEVIEIWVERFLGDNKCWDSALITEDHQRLLHFYLQPLSISAQNQKLLVLVSCAWLSAYSVWNPSIVCSLWSYPESETIFIFLERDWAGTSWPLEFTVLQSLLRLHQLLHQEKSKGCLQNHPDSEESEGPWVTKEVAAWQDGDMYILTAQPCQKGVSERLVTHASFPKLPRTAAVNTLSQFLSCGPFTTAS